MARPHSPVAVTSGVPQGSVLGPTLFLAFINDLPDYVQLSQVRLFADDTILYLAVSAVDECNKLQEDLLNLERWEKNWSMAFHPPKCNVLHITRKRNKLFHKYVLHGQTLESVPAAKYLGVTLTDDMTWNKHIDRISSSANSKLGFLRRNLKVRDPRLRETAYKAIVRPCLEYCPTVWDPHTQQGSKRLEMVQRRAARWVTGRFHNTSSVTDMLAQLGWRSLALRRTDFRLVMLYKIVTGVVDVQLTDFTKLQRDKIHIQPIFARTQYYQFSFFPRTVADWNALPLAILQAPSVTSFKRRVSQVPHALPY